MRKSSATIVCVVATKRTVTPAELAGAAANVPVVSGSPEPPASPADVAAYVHLARALAEAAAHRQVLQAVPVPRRHDGRVGEVGRLHPHEDGTSAEVA